MPIIEPVIRPPSERKSFLLQITTGCSLNTCTFCGAYQNKPFSVKKESEIFKDIDEYAKFDLDLRRVFLLDGDALVVSNNKLIPILKEINNVFPKLARISSYANGNNIVNRSKEELNELYDHKLSLIYIGLESGSEDILKMCNKKSSARQMIEAVVKANESGIKSSVIVLLGLGGKEHSKKHVRDTISVLNKMQPRYLSFLSLMLIKGTSLYEQCKKKQFVELDSSELLNEAHDIVEGLELEKTIFRCNHASNFLPLEGRLPKDKPVLLGAFKKALDGKVFLKPNFLRGL